MLPFLTFIWQQLILRLFKLTQSNVLTVFFKSSMIIHSSPSISRQLLVAAILDAHGKPGYVSAIQLWKVQYCWYLHSVLHYMVKLRGCHIMKRYIKRACRNEWHISRDLFEERGKIVNNDICKEWVIKEYFFDKESTGGNDVVTETESETI